MFKIGEKVVFINDKDLPYWYNDNFILYNTYIVKHIKKDDIIIFKENHYCLSSKRFITLQQFRKQKLNKICTIH